VTRNVHRQDALAADGGAMKLQLVSLFALAAYMVYATTFAELVSRLLPFG
jgi:hypothetical protein